MSAVCFVISILQEHPVDPRTSCIMFQLQSSSRNSGGKQSTKVPRHNVPGAQTAVLERQLRLPVPPAEKVLHLWFLR